MIATVDNCVMQSGCEPVRPELGSTAMRPIVRRGSRRSHALGNRPRSENPDCIHGGDAADRSLDVRYYGLSIAAASSAGRDSLASWPVCRCRTSTPEPKFAIAVS